MLRRTLLIGLGAGAVGLAGWRYRDDVEGLVSEAESIVDENLGPPETENAIREMGGDGFLRRFVLYESGAARLIFADDYGCHERIAVGDTVNLRGDNLRVWQLPSDGELVVDMKSAIQGTRDPSNVFWLDSLGADGRFCFGANDINFRFRVPPEWIR